MSMFIRAIAARERLKKREWVGLTDEEIEPIAETVVQPKQYLPTMDDAIAAGNGVLMNEQAALLRECRSALDSLIQQKPQLAGLLCGSTTLGNLKASLYGYRPQGVFNPKEWQGLTDEEIYFCTNHIDRNLRGWANEFARSIEAKLRSKNG